jgi:hypothetical protein
MGGLSPEARSIRSSIGAYSLHAKYDSRELTRNARAAFLARFDELVDPEGVLAPEERARRAEAAMKAHMLRLALASAKARSKRAET